jgi:response regulator RpfG family c-di-GMP phosphodiesterase
MMAALTRQRTVSRGIELLNSFTLVSVIEPLALAIEHHAGRSPSRVLRIRHYTAALAENQNLPKGELVAIEIAALLGGVGQFPPPCKFWEIGANILNVAPPLAAAAPIVEHRFQRWDGTGFPGGLKGSAIPLGARILAIAEHYVRLTEGTNESNMEEACNELQKQSGKLFDPALVLDFCGIADVVTKSFRIPEALAAVLETLDQYTRDFARKDWDWADWAEFYGSERSTDMT